MTTREILEVFDHIKIKNPNDIYRHTSLLEESYKIDVTSNNMTELMKLKIVAFCY